MMPPQDVKKPRIINAQRASILAQMAAIVLLLKRGFAFITRISHLFRKLQQTNDPAVTRKPTPPSIPISIANLIPLE